MTLERYTQLDQKGEAICTPEEYCNNACYNCPKRKNQLLRLAYYENTGFSPSTVDALKFEVQYWRESVIAMARAARIYQSDETVDEFVEDPKVVQEKLDQLENKYLNELETLRLSHTKKVYELETRIKELEHERKTH